MLTFLIVSFFLFALGTVIGSFLNVIIYRSMNDETWVKGRSKCESCKKTIAWYDNIPLLSFLVLGGKCRHCQEPIAISHPVVEFLTGVLFVWWYVGGFFFFKLTQHPFLFIQPLFWLLVGMVLLVIFFADLWYMIIPDEAVFLLALLTLFYRVALTGSGVMRTHDFLLTLAVTSVCFALFFGLWFFTKGRGLGFGDVKFMIPFGLLLGWPGAVVGLFVAFVSGGAVSAVLLLLRKKKLKQTVPFGPFLVGATVFSLVWGSQVWEWYMGLLR